MNLRKSHYGPESNMGQKTTNRAELAPKREGSGAAVSSKNGALEPYLSDLKISRVNN
jgi:hypothetical protein